MDYTVKAQLKGFRYKTENFSVCSVEILSILKSKNGKPFNKGDKITIVGSLPLEIMIQDQKYIISGIWELSKWGHRLKTESIFPCEPETEEDIEKFLTSGIIKGIRDTMAKKIVSHFGKNALNVIEENPEKLTEIKGVGEKTAQKIISSYQEQKELLNRLFILMSLGLSVTYAKKVLSKWGVDAYEKIKKNPYILTQLHGIGFLKADAIAKYLGISPDDPFRIRAGIEYVLNELCYTKGHTYLPENELVDEAKKVLDVDETLISWELGKIPEDKIIKIRKKVYPTELYKAEKTVGQFLSSIKKVRIKNIEVEGELTWEQKRALRMALLNRVSAITGLPGTGKTYSIKALISELEKASKSYILCAPTGKAAKRVEELTGKKALTIHRLLEAKWSEERGRVIFKRNKDNPLSEDYVIVDEVSMVDIVLMQKLVDAIRKDGCLVLVGDYNQLPSVSPGSVLRDIVKNGLCPSIELKDIHRQAEGSSIVKAAHAIHYGRRVTCFNDYDFVFVEEENPEIVANEIIKIATMRRFGDPEDVQVLSPMKKGPCGTEKLNELLREKLRPYYAQKMGCSNGNVQIGRFMVGDKVIQLSNNYEKEVFNGEIGYVLEADADERKIKVKFEDKVIEYKDFELDELGYAYALTIHKFQGSEAKCVITPIVMSHFIMLSRNLIYTAVTRAKEKFVFVGTKNAFGMAVKNDKPVKRYGDLSRINT